MALLATACLTVASCSWDDSFKPAGGGGEPVEAKLLTFFQSGGAGFPALATVLRSRTDAKAVGGWFAGSRARGKPRLEKTVLPRDYGREAVLVFSFDSGCTSADGARLLGDGPRFSVELTGTESHQECYAPFGNLAVFAVDKAKVPDNVTLAGARQANADPVSPAELLEFEKLAGRPDTSVRAAEVTQPDQLEDFVGGLPEPVAARLDVDGHRRSPDDRRFAFVLSGCRAKSAILTITEERLAAKPSGGGGARCDIAEHYVAVFQVEGRYVPATAVIG